MQAIAEHEAHLTAYLLKKLSNIQDITIFGITDPARVTEKVGVVPISVKDKNHYLVAAILSAEGGIGVRNGCFCAHPYLFELLKLTPQQSQEYQGQVIRGRRDLLPGLVRISFGCYNNESDVDWLIEVLERIVRNDYKGTYVQDQATGACWPKGYALKTQDFFQLG